MSKECREARNIVVIAMLILITIMLYNALIDNTN